MASFCHSSRDTIVVEHTYIIDIGESIVNKEQIKVDYHSDILRVRVLPAKLKDWLTGFIFTS
jgi:hypothetical protein